MLPADKLPDVAAARAGVAKLAELGVEIVLVGDGDDLLSGGAAALASLAPGPQRSDRRWPRLRAVGSHGHRPSGVAIALASLLARAAACHPPASAVQTASVARAAAPVGGHAPGGTMQAADGTQVALADVWPAHADTVLVFYRGFW